MQEPEIPRTLTPARRSAPPGRLSALMHFLWAGLAKHRQTGGIVPSQRFLVAKMIAPVPTDYAGRIVELGAGNGAITLALAMRCRSARILACEINPTLARDNRSNLTSAGIDGRVDVTTDAAENILSELVGNGMGKPDFIISSIPLRNLGKKRACELIDAISGALDADGMYIQFQHSQLDRKKIVGRFPRTRTASVFLNFPPAIVYYAQR
jgi:phospholipid N-methyltransferase